MRSIYIMATAVAILLTIFLIVKYGGNKNGGQSTPTPTPAATPSAPKTFKFDSSTDLKQELEKVNPQVLDSDFEQ